MVTKFFLKLTDYPVFRRIIWKRVYELLATKFKVKDWSFMNYGYAPSDNETPLKLEQQDEINRYPIQLYYYICSKVNIKGLKILEVGSGRGGGADFINRYFNPEKIIGLDIAINAVKMANENYGSDEIEFIQGSAERLPFGDEDFDVVINIESSHTYGSVERFLSEVERVLRPGGYLLLADLRTSAGVTTLQQQINLCNMEVVSEEDISKNVVRGIELEEPIKQKRIKEKISQSVHPVFKQFAGVVGSKAHKQLISGELVYKRFLLRSCVKAKFRNTIIKTD
jgi:ubiquinone/menaquinone biosynthesis C-methylase UbiE